MGKESYLQKITYCLDFKRIESNGLLNLVNTYFPLTGNDCPNKHEICSTYEDAKMVVETLDPILEGCI
jgi:hypothetical protein